MRQKPNEIIWSPWVVPNGGIDESKSDHELPANKWKSGLDVEPYPEGARRRSGKTRVNNSVLPTIAIEYTGGLSDFSLGGGIVGYVSQSFLVPSSDIIPLAAVSIKLRAASSGTPTEQIECAIYDDNSGEPGTVLTGADFGDFSTIQPDDVDGTYRWVRFVPSGAVLLAVGTTYHFVLRAVGGSFPNFYQVQDDPGASTYTDGQSCTSSDGLVWTQNIANDLNFRIYTKAGGPVTGLLDYNLSNATTQRALVVHKGELYKESGGAMTLVSTPDDAPFSAAADVHESMAVGNDMALITDGIGISKKYYIRSGIEYFENEGISPPTATPTATAVAGGSLTAGDWLVDYYYWNDRLGTASNTRYMGVTGASVTTASSDLSIQISGLPTDVAREGDSATHIRIALKKPGSGIFRFAGTAQGQIVLGSTSTATISFESLGDEPEYDNDVAPTHSLKVVGANQQFIAGISGIPWRVMASKLTAVNSYYESFPSLSYRDFGKGDGDYTTALAFIPPATLIVGMKNSVWALDARSFLTADPVLISKNVGIAGKNSWMVVGRTLFFVSDSDRTKGLMAWDGTQVIPLTAIDKTFKTMNMARLKYASCAFLAPGDTRFQWWTMLSGGGSSQQNRVIVFDFALEAFSVYRHSGNIIGSHSQGGAAARVRIGGTDGHVYTADTGDDDDGTTIESEMTMKRDDYGAPDWPKRVRFLRAEGKAYSQSSLRVTFESDQRGYPAFGGTLDFSSDEAAFILGVSLLGGPDPLGGGSDDNVTTREAFVGKARNIQPKFVSQSAWGLNGYSVGVQMSKAKA